MEATQKVGSIEEILRDVPTIDKVSLVWVDQSWDESPKPIRMDLGHEFHRTILEGDGSESVG